MHHGFLEGSREIHLDKSWTKLLESYAINICHCNHYQMKNLVTVEY